MSYNKLTQQQVIQNRMQSPKNRQSGCIRQVPSTKPIATIKQQPVIMPQHNESFSKFDEEFSSFCYRYPQDQQQNEFSLFVFQKGKVERKSRQGVKENEFGRSNGVYGNREYGQGEKVLDDGEQEEFQQFRTTHKKLIGVNNQPNTNINNYFSAKTSHQNKIGVPLNNYQSTSNYQSSQNNKTSLNNAQSPTSRKQIGKLRNKSKQHINTDRQNTNNYRVYLEQRGYEQNEEEQYYALQQLYRQQHLNYATNQPAGYQLRKVRSSEHFARYDPYEKNQSNHQEEQYIQTKPKLSRQQIKFHNEQFNLQRLYNPYQQPTIPSKSPRSTLPQNINPTAAQVNLSQGIIPKRKSYKQVQESQVVESQPSFLKDRIQQVQRKKKELAEKKRQLEQLKRKNEEIIYEQSHYSSRHTSVKNSRNKQLQIKNNGNPEIQLQNATNTGYLQPTTITRTQNIYSVKQQSKQIAHLHSQSDYDQSSESFQEEQPQQSDHLTSEKESSMTSEQQQDVEDGESEIIQKRQSHKQSKPSRPQQQASQAYEAKPSHQIERQQPLYTKPNQNPAPQPTTKLSKPSFTSNIINLNIPSPQRPQNPPPHQHLKPPTSQLKTNPLQIATTIQNRSNKLKQQQLKQQYQKQGIAVSKGGVAFDVDTKEFVFEKDQQGQKPLAQKATRDVGLFNNQRLKKHHRKVDPKEQLKRRRQMAKSYDRYARNKLFGF